MPQTLNSALLTLANGCSVGTGWLPPMFDPRDYTDRHPKVAPIAERLKKRSKLGKAPPGKVDLRAGCSPIENQGQLGSCTAHAAVGMVEYLERRAFGKHLDASRLFVYKTTRNLIGVTGDTGAWLRNTMGALTLCGVPAERYWPYTDQSPAFDKEPPTFVYAIADNYEALKYFAHDPIAKNPPRAQVLESVKNYLAMGLPSVLGFFGYSSFESTAAPGEIPFPTKKELEGDPAWGHAVVAVGYDDQRSISNTADNKKTKGALLIRNSWGMGWGDQGYGWLPYEYVLKNIALDFWSLIKMEYVDSDQFY
ncbi:MAG: cysteine protease [Betaproteobacteria bacterium]|nr:cysteine protease [Betaproteobacteria bacterium]